MKVQLLSLWNKYKRGTKQSRYDTIRISKIRKIKHDYGNLKETHTIKQACLNRNPEKLVSTLNKRLDAILVHCNWSISIIEARNWIKLGYILVNNKIIKYGGYMPNIMDLITVKTTDSKGETIAESIRLRNGISKHWSWLKKLRFTKKPAISKLSFLKSRKKYLGFKHKNDFFKKSGKSLNSIKSNKSLKSVKLANIVLKKKIAMESANNAVKSLKPANIALKKKIT
nr:ribosomal protein S4 [Capsaspora owczarzaki]